MTPEQLAAFIAYLEAKISDQRAFSDERLYPQCDPADRKSFMHTAIVLEMVLIELKRMTT